MLQKSTEDFVKAMNQLKHATAHHKKQTSVCGLPGFDLHIKDFHEISQMPPAKFNSKLSQMTSTSKKFASIATRKNAMGDATQKRKATHDDEKVQNKQRKRSWN